MAGGKGWNLPIKYIALAAALLPFLAIHLSYLLSAWQGHVDWCVPYWQGCTSISGGGREGAAFYVFKGLMIPAAVILCIFWWCYGGWLQALGDGGQRPLRAIVLFGLLASVGLIVYTCALGAEGGVFRLQRRVGVVTYFGFTYFAQLLAAGRLAALAQVRQKRLARTQVGLCLLMLLLGVSNLFCEIFFDSYDFLDDVFEWNFTLLVMGFYLSNYWLWRWSDGCLQLLVSDGSRAREDEQ